jgi:hypothetical protein
MIESNDSRLNKLTLSADMSDKAGAPIDAPTENNLVDSPEVMPEVESPVFTGEEIQVAMLGRKALGEIKNIKSSAFKKTVSEVQMPNAGEVPTPPVEPVATIPTVNKRVNKKELAKLKDKVNQQAPADLQEFNLQVEQSKQDIILETEKIAQAEAAGDDVLLAQAREQLKSPNKAINLLVASDNIDDQAVLDALSQSIPARTTTATQAELVVMAEEAGYDPKFINSLSSKTLPANSENMATVMVMQKDIKNSLKELFVKVGSKEATADERLMAVKQMQLYQHLFSSVKGYKSDTASALSMAKVKVDDVLASKEAQDLLNNTMPADRLDELARMIMDDTFSDADFGNVISSAVAGDDGWSKAKRLWSNNVLGGPGTLSRLGVGESLKAFGVLPLTRAGAATAWYATYPLKKLVGMDTAERYYFTEAYAMLKAYKQASIDGAQLASKAWKSGISSQGGASRAELSGNKSVDIFKYNTETLAGKGLATLNLLASYGGKLTLSGGEFFKGINYRLETVAYATRKEIDTFNEYLDYGRSIDEASMASKNSYADALNNPPDNLWDEAKKSVLEQDAGPITKKLEELTQLEGATGLAFKTMFSFARTTANDIYNLIEYTPAGLAISGDVNQKSAFHSVLSSLKNGRLMKDLKSADPKKVDMAVSRMAVGSSVMYGFASLAADGYITGSGPGDKKTRDAMMAQGWQPNSIKIPKSVIFPFSDNKETFTTAQQQELNMLPNATIGKNNYSDYVFVSLSGLGLVGSLAQVSANYTEYSLYERDNEKVKQPVAAIIGAISDYMDDSVLVNGAMKALTGLHQVYKEREDIKAEGIVKDTTSSIVEMLHGLVPGSRLLSSIRTTQDINTRNTAADPNEDAVMQGLKEGINKLYNKTPGLSTTLPLSRNWRNEPIDVEYPLSPLKVKEGKADKVNKIIEMSQAKVGTPPPFLNQSVETEDMQKVSVKVDLSPDEYDELLRIANRDLNVTIVERIQSVVDSFDKMRNAYDLDNKDLSRKELNERSMEFLRSVALELESAAGSAWTDAKDVLYNDSKYSNVLQARAKREAASKISTYKIIAPKPDVQPNQ